MFRIRRIYDNTLEIDRQQIAQVQQILRAQFPLVLEKEILKLPDRLQNPIKYRFRSILFVADDNKKNVKGFALLLHDADINFCYLDYISSAKALVGRAVVRAILEGKYRAICPREYVEMVVSSFKDDPVRIREPKYIKKRPTPPVQEGGYNYRNLGVNARHFFTGLWKGTFSNS